MKVNEIQAKSLLRKQKKIDSWFLSYYGMNLYRGCLHNCAYCDGRAEKYNVEGDFGKEIAVKANAVELLKRELDPRRKRKPMKHSFIFIGGGVGDSYQSVEKDYEFCPQVLNLLCNNGFPVHILTKSTLVERDIQLLKAINGKTKAIVSFSFSTIDEHIAEIFEPGVPSPKERLQTIKKLKDAGIACGMYLLPVIPFISDLPDKIENSIAEGIKAGVDFICFGGMTLKPGRQREYFFSVLNKHFPDLIHDYNVIYGNDKWGNANYEYYRSLDRVFDTIASGYNVPKRIPLSLFNEWVDENDRVIVILEHIDYLQKIKGRKSPYGYAAYSISKLKQPLSSMQNHLTELKGVGSVTERIIKEILKTGTCTYYQKLMQGL